MIIDKPLAFLNWDDKPVLEFRHSNGYMVEHARFVFRSREQLDGLIVKLQQLSADMRTREPK